MYILTKPQGTMDKEALHALAQQATPGKTLSFQVNTTGPILHARFLIEMDGRVLDLPTNKRSALQQIALDQGPRLVPLTVKAKVVGQVDPEWFANLHEILDQVEVLN